VQLSKLEASYVGVSFGAQLGLVFTLLVQGMRLKCEYEGSCLPI